MNFTPNAPDPVGYGRRFGPYLYQALLADAPLTSPFPSNLSFPALQSSPTAVSGASRKKQVAWRNAVWIILLVLFITGCQTWPADSPQSDPQKAAQKIRKTYESADSELSIYQESHFAIRLWRTTDQDNHDHVIDVHAQSLKKTFLKHAVSSRDKHYQNKIAQEMLEIYPESLKRNLRKQALASHGEYIFMKKLAYLAYRIKDYGLDTHPEVKVHYRNVIEALRKHDWKPAILNNESIKYDGSQTANVVYYLQKISVIDLEKPLLEKLRYMSQQKQILEDPVIYENFIYALTHVIIAKSDYYQQSVDPESVQWILNYMSRNLDEILKRLDPDVVAEVGLCFKLVNKKNHPVVFRTQSEILRYFHPRRGHIISIKTLDDLAKLEHRNCVAYLLLHDWKTLRRGPRLVHEKI